LTEQDFYCIIVILRYIKYIGKPEHALSRSINIKHDSDILKALGHPVRLKMVFGLIENYECNVNKMVEELKLPQSTVSQHLAILKNKGIIAFRKEGVKACYKVVDKKVLQIIELLKK
jgi:ArsR family transcriptional regulator, arsenate/arsenite/antimonite-responsive transcriptional repressor